MAVSKADYRARGAYDARVGQTTQRPIKPGWQLDAYEAGVASVRWAQETAPVWRQPKSIQALSAQRVGVLLGQQFPPPVISHLNHLNHQYVHEKVTKRADRLLGSMGRVMNRWLPRP